MEPDKQTPSVMARLMGLDDLSCQLPRPLVHKRRRVLSENYLRKTAAIGQCEKSVLHSGHSYRAANNQRGKNGVGEEISVIGRTSLWSVSGERVHSTESRMDISSTESSGFAKHPLVDKKLHRLKEFDNVTGDLRLNQGKQSRYLQQPVLPKKQLEGRHSHEPHFAFHSKAFDSFSGQGHRKSGFCDNSNKGATPKSILSSLQKLQNVSLSGPFGKFQINNSHKILINKSDLNDKRRVSLSGNALNSAGRTSLVGSSAALLSGDGKKADLVRAGEVEGNSEAAGKERNGAVKCSRRDNRVLKNIKKRIAEESRLFMPSCPSINFQERVGWNLHPPNGSGLATGGNNQIIKRWKQDNIFEGGNIASKRCTLGKMLDVSDKKANPLFHKLDRANSYALLSRQNGQLVSVNRFALTSRIGGKVEKRLSPQSRLHLHKSSARNEAFHRDQLLRREEADGVELGKTRNHKGDVEARKSIMPLKKRQIPRNLNLENRNMQEYVSFYKPLSSINLCINPDDGYSDVLHPATGILASSAAEAVSTDGQGSDVDISSSEFKDLLFDSMLGSAVKADDAAQVSETSYGQTSSDDLDVEGSGFSSSTRSGSVFHKNFREINQQSPNSVLDLPFPDGNVHTCQGLDAADLYSVARRLQLQSSISEETYSEGTEMDVSSYEDAERGSVKFCQDAGELLEEFDVEESRNFSYLVDVLDEAGLTGNLEGFTEWESAEYPMHNSVFEALEKKYGKHTSWEKSERRLLFDRMNARLKEVLTLDITLCTMPLRKRFSASLRRDVVEEELWTLLSNKESPADKGLSQNGLGMETNWLQLNEGIHDIGLDIVNNLFDELVGELAGTEDSYN